MSSQSEEFREGLTKKGKISHMKHGNNAAMATLIALAFAFAPVVQAGPRLDGGPIGSPTDQIVAGESDAGASISKELVRISFAPVGLTLNQTARLNLVNTNVANGITVSCRFMDANGVILAQSYTTLGVGKIVSVDFKRQSDPVPGPVSEQLRAEVQVQLDIFTSGAQSESVRRSLEVFDNKTGQTTVYMAGVGS